jgi:hypothetical protein
VGISEVIGDEELADGGNQGLDAGFQEAISFAELHHSGAEFEDLGANFRGCTASPTIVLAVQTGDRDGNTARVIVELIGRGLIGSVLEPEA